MKISIRTRLMALAAVAALCLPLAGCGSKESDTPDKTAGGGSYYDGPMQPKGKPSGASGAATDTSAAASK